MLDLITLAEYKIYAKIQSSEQDDRLNLLIPSVSTLVKTYCGRTFVDYATTTKTEYNSEGGRYIYLDEQPILTVTSVMSRSYAAGAYVTLTPDVDYVIDKQFDYLYNISDEEGFPTGPNATKIIYTGGYEDPPEDLKLGVMDLVQFYVKNESVMRKSLNSNQVSVEYTRTLPQDFPPHIKRVLELYRIH